MKINLSGLFQGWAADSRFKLSIKILGGFVVVLSLAAIAIAIGYDGLNGVVSQVNSDRQLGRLVNQIKTARLHEKDFMSSGQAAHAEVVKKLVAQVRAGLLSASNEFNLAVNQAQLAAVAGQVEDYGKGFDLYIKLAADKTDSLKQMTAAGQAAQTDSRRRTQ